MSKRDKVLDDVLKEDHQWSDVRKKVKERMSEGASLGSLAMSFIEAAEAAIARGDTAEADAALFHAVHAGVPPHQLFMECKGKFRPKEA